ncbi:MAG: ABC transporter permease [Actinomycetia bacterium]|nr:ABC transporter permease [Actinomycetes bacterium]
MRPLFLLRWAARDLRQRWVQVAVIALIIAIGTGVYSALGSTATWRRQSNDASFELTGMYDLRVKATEGADAPTGSMLDVLGGLSDPTVVADAEERLITATQVDASTAGETILVPGRIIGLDLSDDGPALTSVFVEDGHGRTLSTADSGQAVAVLERNFARFYDLPESGTVDIAGGRSIPYVGRGLAPEYFFVITEEGSFFAEANFAVLFMPLESAQEVTGRPGRVNDLVIRLSPGTDPAWVAAELETRFAGSGLDLGVTLMEPDDEDAYRVLYDDIEGDQKVNTILAGLIVAGATFGAFNLASRMVEAQRREIGIGMALGMPPHQIAVRPLLVGAQIAVLGTVLGVVVGWLVIMALRPAFTGLLPLPVWTTEFQPRLFAQGAVLGFALPLIATAWPVWRAIRVTPIQAITTVHRQSRGGLAPLLRRAPRPLSAFRRMPIGNVLRAPRRTLLTAFGIGAAIATLVTLLGMLDSLFDTLDRNEAEVMGLHPDRVSVALDGYQPVDGPVVAAVTSAASTGQVEPVVRTGASASTGAGEPIELLLEALDFDNSVWAPTIENGIADPTQGIVIAEKAATDLGVGVGDRVSLLHPTVTATGFAMVTSELPVGAIHPGPFRFNAYLDRSLLDRFGAGHLANQLYVLPGAGMTPDDVEAELFGIDGVTSVQPVAASTRIVKDSIEDFTAVFQILQGFILFLAALIAYNTTSINADERARERATLFAFGLPLRRVIGLEMAEGLLYGILGTLVGVGFGTVILRWVVLSTFDSTMPDLGIRVTLSATTLITALILGVVAVGIAPLLTARRLRRMDIPTTLRVVE